MKKRSSPKSSPLFTGRKPDGFTLVELLVVISIIGILASLALTAMQRVRKAAAETKSSSIMRSTLQASVLYSSENDGHINILKYPTDTMEGGAKWVGNTYWGRLQPYIFPGIKETNQSKLQAAILSQINRLFGCTDIKTMAGTPFAGSKRYYDTSSLPIPFVFNKYLYEPKYSAADTKDGWITPLEVDSASATILMSYGFGMFSEKDAQTYVATPTNNTKSTSNIYFLPSQQAMLGFLDGHVANLPVPIAANMVTIDDQTN